MLSPVLLVAAYEAGYFPMAMDDGEIQWYSPDPRGVLPLDGFHAPRRRLRVIRSGRFEVSIDRAFRQVMEACAADRDDGTWINGEILETPGTRNPAQRANLHASRRALWSAGSRGQGREGRLTRAPAHETSERRNSA